MAKERGRGGDGEVGEILLIEKNTQEPFTLAFDIWEENMDVELYCQFVNFFFFLFYGKPLTSFISKSAAWNFNLPLL